MKISCSYKAHGFQALLEKLPTAKSVTIVTYSLDTVPQSQLLDRLRQLQPQCRLTIITNIPNRFEDYFGRAGSRARKSIDAYLDTLMPGNFHRTSDVYFSFNNHSKILIVDETAYVGSANFTEASANNFEAGVIVAEKSQIDELTNFTKTILKSAIPLLKIGGTNEGRTIFRLVLWGAEIVRSVREENDFEMSETGEWIDADQRELRKTVKVSARLRSFLQECKTAAEEMSKRCGGSSELLNEDALNEVLEFIRHFEDQSYNESLPAPFDDKSESNFLVEELLHECSNDGDVDDVMRHPKYQELLDAARTASEQRLDAAVSDAVEELVAYINNATSKLRWSFEEEDVSPKIDNTRAPHGAFRREL